MTNSYTKKERPSKLQIYGRQPVIELLRSGQPVTQVTIAKESAPRDRQLIESLAEKKNCPVRVMPKSQLQRVCGPVLHQGFTAEMSGYKFISQERVLDICKSKTAPFFLILDQVQDPHNLGAILRSAEIAGVDAVIIPEKGSAPVSETVAKTSAGALFFVDVHQTTNLDQLLVLLSEHKITLAATVPHDAESIYESDLSCALALIIGSEGKGVRKNLLRLCDKRLSIPQFGKVNSLNASVSAAIVTFEAVRQRTLNAQ